MKTNIEVGQGSDLENIKFQDRERVTYKPKEAERGNWESDTLEVKGGEVCEAGVG